MAAAITPSVSVKSKLFGLMAGSRFGSLVHSSIVTFVPAVDQIPFPAYSSFNYSRQCDEGRLQDLTDQALMEGVRGGDVEAIAAIFNRYSNLVYNIALQVLGSRKEAEATMQDVLMHLWLNSMYLDFPLRPLSGGLAVLTRKKAKQVLTGMIPASVSSQSAERR